MTTSIQKMNTLGLKRINLDTGKTIEHVHSQLMCDHILSHALVHLINLEGGSFFTMVPSSASIEKLYDFNSDGIFTQHHNRDVSEEPPFQSEMSKFIMSKLDAKPNQICIFEELAEKATDKKRALFSRFGKAFEGWFIM